MLGRFVRSQGGVRATHHDLHAALPEPLGDLIAMRGIRRIDRDGHQINRALVSNALVVLIQQRYPVFRLINEARQVGHRDLSEIVELPPAKAIDLLVFGRDQQDCFCAVLCLHRSKRSQHPGFSAFLTL